MKRALPLLLLAALLVAAVVYLLLPPAAEDSGTSDGGEASPAAEAPDKPEAGSLQDRPGATRRADRDGLPVRVFGAAGEAVPAGTLHARVDEEPLEVAISGGLAQLPRGKKSLGAAAQADGRWSAWSTLRGEELAAAQELRLDLAEDAAGLRLRVLLDDGAAVPQPRLLLTSEDLRADASLPADGWLLGAEGELTHEGLAPGDYVVELAAEGCLSYRDSWTLEAGSTLERTLTLQRGGFLEGRLRGPDGAVEDARVLAVDAAEALQPFSGLELFRTYGRMPPESEQEHETRSGADGSWRIEGVPAGEYLLLVRAEGLRPFVVEPAFTVHPARPTRLGLQELRAGNTVEVLVRAVDGRPQAEVDVAWRSSAEGLVGRFVETGLDPVLTDAEGRAVLHAVAEGLVMIEARHASSAPVEEALEFPTGSAVTRSVELTLEAGVAVSGSVLSEADGQPLEGAEVSLYAVSAGGMELMMGTAPTARAETAADGSFRADRLRAGTYTLRVEAEGHAPRVHGPVEVEADTQLEPLLLGTGAVLEVLARDDQGAPLPGALVTVTSMASASNDNARTDEFGRVRFEALPPGRYQVALVGGMDEGESQLQPGALDIAMKFLELEAGAEEFIELGGGGQTADVEGFVTRRGQPVAGANMILILPSGAKTARTEADGAYAMAKVPVGEHVLMVQMSAGGMGGGSHYTGLEVPAGGTVRRDITLPGAAVEVLVLDAGGGPLAQMPVSLRPLDGEHISGADFGMTDAEGLASFDSVAAGEYQVSAGRATLPILAREELDRYGAQQRKVSVAAGSEATERVELRLQEGATFRVRVSDREGNYLSGASMHYLDQDGQPLNILAANATNSKGVAQMKGLPAGPGHILVRHPDHGVSEFEVELRAGEVAKREVTLEAGTLLYVDVVDGEDQALGGVLVIATDARGAPLSTLWTMQESESVRSAYFGGGPQRLGPLPPGRYTVRLVRPGRPTVKHELTLRGEAERRVRLAYQP